MKVLNNTRSIITKGKTSATPTANQKKAMADVLETLGFYSQLFENLAP